MMRDVNPSRQTRQNAKRKGREKFKLILRKISSHTIFKRILHDLHPTGSIRINFNALLQSFVNFDAQPGNEEFMWGLKKYFQGKVLFHDD